MKILAYFTQEGIKFRDAFRHQYERYLHNKPNSFLAWIILPGTHRTQPEHNAFWGDIGLVAKKLKVSTEWVYWRTRNDPDFLQDIFEIDEYSEDGRYLGKRTRGLSEIDHEEMVMQKIIERFRQCWQDEINQYYSDEAGYPVQVKMNWYSRE